MTPLREAIQRLLLWTNAVGIFLCADTEYIRRVFEAVDESELAPMHRRFICRQYG